MKEIHLICNAHIDPVWQWEWEEGAASAVSTFRAAADFCEEFDNFVFCHNEALLYRWIEEYEPELFERIRRLVKAGKWHIMGGWYLQPDCNMPSGESIIRQMQLGRAYFSEKFGVSNNTAVNFDPFGHNRGLVQLMAKAGYDSYLIMRPYEADMKLPSNDFVWVGYDGSEVMVHRLDMGYNSALGKAREKVEQWLQNHPDVQIGLVTWGVGNHGGGPSREDISALNELMREQPESGLKHSTPEAYFKVLSEKKKELPRVHISLNPFAVGCYTSQIRVKQLHRLLEGQLAVTERMLSHAAMTGLLAYPTEDMLEANRALCMSEFHDTLPGSSIQPVEETGIQNLHHGLEIVNRLRARAFFALSAGQKPAESGTYPILVYNPHPYPVEQVIECEFMLADQNWKDEFTDMEVFGEEGKLAGQIEKERSNLPLDWRKRVVFRASLKPMQMNRFDCVPHVLPHKTQPSCAVTNGAYEINNEHLKVRIDLKTGLLVSYNIDGFEYLRDGAMKLLVIKDSVDPWGMTVDRFRNVEGAFSLMDEAESARFAGVEADTLPPVRVVEDGPVRTVIEAGFVYGNSRALITYRVPKQSTSVGIEVRLQFAEKDRMVKLSIPGVLNERYLGQAMFGMDELHMDGRECVSQGWAAVVGEGRVLSLINDSTYGSDFENGEMRISLIRGAAYTAHPIMDRTILPQDRFTPRIDQGERLYRFELNGGMYEKRMEVLSREAQQMNEPAYALSFFPSKNVKPAVPPLAEWTGDGIRLTMFRPAVKGDSYIARLFNDTDAIREGTLTVSALAAQAHITLKPYEIYTLRISADGTVSECSLLD